MLDKEVEDLLNEYVELGEQIKKLDERKQAIKDKIVAERGSKFKLGNFSIYDSTSIILDRSYLKKKYPSAYEDCLRKSSYAITIRKVKKV